MFHFVSSTFCVDIFLNSSPRSPFELSPATSVSPNDSISQHTGGSRPVSRVARIQPTVRPSHYPPEILWNLDDCRTDPDVQLSESNKSRPPMEKAIRYPDGRMISGVEWNGIKAAARAIKNELLKLPAHKDRHGKSLRRTKIYFRTQYPTQYEAALEKLEEQQPLLALCAAHWKADHVIGSSLISAGSKKEFSEDEDSDTLPVPKRSRKRSEPSFSPQKKRETKKKRKEKSPDTTNEDIIDIISGM